MKNFKLFSAKWCLVLALLSSVVTTQGQMIQTQSYHAGEGPESKKITFEKVFNIVAPPTVVIVLGSIGLYRFYKKNKIVFSPLANYQNFKLNSICSNGDPAIKKYQLIAAHPYHLDSEESQAFRILQRNVTDHSAAAIEQKNRELGQILSRVEKRSWWTYTFGD